MPLNRRPAFKSRHETQAYDFRSFMPEDIMARWKPEIHAAESTDDSAINIYDIVGQDYWTGLGVTAVKVADVLKKNKGKEITVNINSPGGDFFEGLAIYNLLKEHDGDITVRVVGMAASAASVVGVSADDNRITLPTFGHVLPADALLEQDNALEQCFGPRRASGDVHIDRDDLVHALGHRVRIPVRAATVGARTHGDDVLGVGHLVVQPLDRRGHLVGHRA
jgi:hypothetical protein